MKDEHRSEKKGSISHHVAGVDDNEFVAAEEMVAHEAEFTPREYKKLMLKVDLILMPMLMIIYGLQFADKTSLSSGVIFGLREDTGLTLAQYSNLTTFFYMAYAFAQYPMAWVLQHIPLGRGLAACVVIWGAMVMILGACNNYASLAAVRVFLGWFEAVVTPGFAIFTSSWYLRKEQTLRQGLYYAMNSFFGIIFGLGVYYVALDAQERGGLAAWRVINLFLGGTTVGMGIIFGIFGGTPDEVWWLSKREKLMAKARIVSNGTGGGERHPWRWDQVKECLRDPQYWFAMMFNLLGNIPNGGLTTFQNLIFKSFGFTSFETILYGLPMYGVTCVCVVASSITVRYYSKARFPIVVLAQFCTMTALLVAGVSGAGKWQKYGVWMLNLLFSIGSFIVAWPMISLNVAGRTKKSFFGGSSLFVYCAGNIIGSQVFRPSDAPKYKKGLTACAVTIAANIINIVCWCLYYIRQNRKREAEMVAQGVNEEERQHLNRVNGELDMTDRTNPHFRYMW